MGVLWIIAGFLALTALTWRRWADLIVDFGRELYVPWRLSEGQTLADIQIIYGQLPFQLNAALYSIFGVSFQTLFCVNLAIAGGITLMIYALFRDAFDEFTATLAGLSFIVVAVFPQMMPYGIFNFVTPFAHGSTHGVAWAVLMILLLGRSAALHPAWMAMAGLALGCVFLSKAEVFAAAALAAATFFGLTLARAYRSRWALARAVLIFSAAAWVPPVALVLDLSREMSLPTALTITAGSWPYILFSRVSDTTFNQWHMGLDDVSANLMWVAGTFLFYGAMLAGLAVACSPLKDRRWGAVRGLAAALVALGAATVALYGVRTGARELLLALTRPLQLTTVAFLALLALDFLRQRRSPAAADRLMPALLWGVFSGGMLLRKIFNTETFSYGFYMVSPAFLFFVAFLVGYFPHRWSGRLRVRTMQWMTSGLVVAVLVSTLWISFGYYRARDYVLGSGADAIRVMDPAHDPRIASIEAFLAWAREEMEPDATFTVLPEGILLNFLLRRPSPIRLTEYVPGVDWFRERDYIAELKTNPPDYIVLLHRPTTEHGVALLGQEGYGRELLAFVRQRYRRTRLFGEEPLKEVAQFGIDVLERVETPTKARLGHDHVPKGSASAVLPSGYPSDHR